MSIFIYWPLKVGLPFTAKIIEQMVVPCFQVPCQEELMSHGRPVGIETRDFADETKIKQSC